MAAAIDRLKPFALKTFTRHLAPIAGWRLGVADGHATGGVQREEFCTVVADLTHDE